MCDKVYVIVEFDCHGYFLDVVLTTTDKEYAEQLVDSSRKSYWESSGRADRYEMFERVLVEL